MPGNIRLHYGRDGETYSGALTVNGLPFSDGGEIEHFAGYTFARMMSRLAKQIRRFNSGNVKVTLSRKEKAQSDYHLDKDTVQLLRDDPAAAIRAMTHPHRIYTGGKTPAMGKDVPQKHVGVSMGARLRAGHDTLADAFGDELYLTVDPARGVECPVCGRFKGELAEISQHSTARMFGCHSCMNGFIIQPCGDKWATIRTEELINSTQDRFYLPRGWNKSGPWITRIELTRMYRAFEKERADV